MWRRWLLVLLLGTAPGKAVDVAQMIIGLAPDWNAQQGKIWLCEREGKTWRVQQPPIEVLFGKNGLAWGRGVRGQDEPGLAKRERDGRAPAGLFRIGKIYTYDQTLPTGADYPFYTVTAKDAWIDNPASPDYNRHVAVDLKNPPPWYAKERMRLDDFAYHWLVEIRANSDPPLVGAGSAIFFHIRRGPTRPTAGCTTMASNDLVRVIRWLRRNENPHYALLPRGEYAARQPVWDLPPLALLAP